MERGHGGDVLSGRAGDGVPALVRVDDVQLPAEAEVTHGAPADLAAGGTQYGAAAHQGDALGVESEFAVDRPPQGADQGRVVVGGDRGADFVDHHQARRARCRRDGERGADALKFRVLQAEFVLDVLRVQIASSYHQGLFAAAGDVEIPFVQGGEIAGAQPVTVLAVEGEAEGLLGLLLGLPVAGADGGSLEDQLADLAGRQNTVPAGFVV